MFNILNVYLFFEKLYWMGLFYFYINNIQEFWSKLESYFNICYLFEVFDYGMWEFVIYDNNGYLLKFG